MLGRSKAVLKISALFCACAMLSFTAAGCGPSDSNGKARTSQSEVILRAPETSGGMTLNEALSRRRSRRNFSTRRLELNQVSQLLWAAQGVTEPSRGSRTAPSAGALYPLEVYLLWDGVLSRYLAVSNSLEAVKRDLEARELADAAGQAYIERAPAVFAICGDLRKTEAKYGDRAQRYVFMEAGHAAQNLVLAATALGLGAVTVGAFDDATVKGILNLSAGQEPLYLIPVGYSAE